MKKILNNLSGGVKFLLSMIVIYLALFLLSPNYFNSSLIFTANDFVGLLPILLFFFFIIFLINLYLNPEIIKRHLGNDSGIKGWFYTFLGSVFLTIPPYIAFPMLKELKSHGMKHSLIALYLNNRNVQPAFLPVMAYYFGLKFTIVISVYILIFAFLNAFIMSKIMKNSG